LPSIQAAEEYSRRAIQWRVIDSSPRKVAHRLDRCDGRPAQPFQRKNARERR
jgi:hypothetical protein